MGNFYTFALLELFLHCYTLGKKHFGQFYPGQIFFYTSTASAASDKFHVCDVDVGDGVGVGDDDGDGYINVAPTYQWPLLIKRNPRQVFLLTALARLASPSTNCTKRYFDTR